MTVVDPSLGPSLRTGLRRSPPRLGSDAWTEDDRWSPAPIPRASLWLHAAAAFGLAGQPEFWPPVLALLAGNHALLATLMHPRGRRLGPNLVTLPDGMAGSIALTFDDGPDPEVTPRVLDLLDRHDAKASFFVVGRRAARQGPLLREMLRRGHTVENHSHHHRWNFACHGPWALRQEVALAQRAIAEATGVAPRFFRAPMGLRSPLLDPVLAMERLQLVAWTRRGYDGRPGCPTRVLERLTRGLAGRDILLLHDTAPRGLPAAVLEVLPRLLACCAAAGLSVESLAAVPTRAGSGGR